MSSVSPTFGHTVVSVNHLGFSSIYITWEDNRHIKGNEGRNVSCKSKHVDWDMKGQFWLPRLEARDVSDLVRWPTVSMYII